MSDVDKTKSSPQVYDDSVHLKIMDLLKEQLLIVFLRRLQGKIEIEASEIDATAGAKFAYGLSQDGKTFSFEVLEPEDKK